ncbi:hypothetical protein ACH5RR_015057 [Cinchona calisaya]|uniref:Uncharacterized protein n=1 Tax=Cinchona calisaya TaxID=153742 RepID=A0ABD2ZSG8_9GENT
MMGLAANLSWVNTYTKKHCRRLFLKMRAAVKNVVKNGGKQQLKFQYDPSSYALNFDDGCYELGEKTKAVFVQQNHNSILHNGCSKSATTTWIYVIFLES